MEPREGRLPDYVPDERPKFIGAYNTFQVYGGPEEGGWWYTNSVHLGSMVLRQDDDILAVARTLWDTFSDYDDGRAITSVLSNGAVFIRYEEKPAEHHNNEKQYYE